MLDYVVQITRDATRISPADHERLRSVGFDDKGILQITLIASWFNYINRVADALGVGRDSSVKKSDKICGVLLVLFVPLIGHAQDDEVVKVKSNLVNIDVIVKDKKGKYVSDLKPEDFVITENGQPQKIEFFDAPLLKSETRKPNETGTTATATTGK